MRHIEEDLIFYHASIHQTVYLVDFGHFILYLLILSLLLRFLGRMQWGLERGSKNLYLLHRSCQLLVLILFRVYCSKIVILIIFCILNTNRQSMIFTCKFINYVRHKCLRQGVRWLQGFELWV